MHAWVCGWPGQPAGLRPSRVWNTVAAVGEDESLAVLPVRSAADDVGLLGEIVCPKFVVGMKKKSFFTQVFVQSAEKQAWRRALPQKREKLDLLREQQMALSWHCSQAHSSNVVGPCIGRGTLLSEWSQRELLPNSRGVCGTHKAPDILEEVLRAAKLQHCRLSFGDLE